MNTAFDRLLKQVIRLNLFIKFNRLLFQNQERTKKIQ